MRCQECRHWDRVGDALPNIGRCARADQTRPDEYLRNFDDFCEDWACNTTPMQCAQGRCPIRVTSRRMRTAAVAMQKAAKGLSHLGYKERAHMLRMASKQLLEWRDALEEENNADAERQR